MALTQQQRRSSPRAMSLSPLKESSWDDSLSNTPVWGQFVSITPNNSQIDMMSYEERNAKRKYKRADSESSQAEREGEKSLRYKLAPGEDYSFSECIVPPSPVPRKYSPVVNSVRKRRTHSSSSRSSAGDRRTGTSKGTQDHRRPAPLPTIVEGSSTSRTSTWSVLASLFFCC